MNNKLLNTVSDKFNTGCFGHDFTGLDDEDLLRYFQHRNTVRFFAVADTDETHPSRIKAILNNQFEFIHECHQLPEPVDWLVNPSQDIEWQILLHKFDYAVGLGIHYKQTRNPRYLIKWISLTQSWIEQTPVGFIAADVTARRVQNWIYAYYHFVHLQPENPIPAEFHRTFLESLHDQVEYLCTNLHSAGNHRTLELHAIFLAAVVFPEFKRAAHWLKFSLQKLIENISTDLLDDGVQCELSTDYHHIDLHSYLCVRRLAKLNEIKFPAEADSKLVQALEFSMHIHKPDGIVPSLSDGDARPYTDLLRQGAELYRREDMLFVASAGEQGNPPLRRTAGFDASGYYILRSDWISKTEAFRDARYLVFDCGPLGAGNHGHLDALNIEVAAYGRSLIVDPGRYTYSESGDVNWRAMFRGTAYHNTVQVDELNQARYLPGDHKHKIQGPAAETTLLANSQEQDLDVIAGRVVSAEYEASHERCIMFIDQRYWVCIDHLTGELPHRYDLRFHLNEAAHGNTQVRAIKGGFQVASPGLLLINPDNEGMKPVLDNGFVSSLYGDKLSAPIVRYTAEAQNACFHSVLYPYTKDRPQLSLSTFTATASEPDHPDIMATGIIIQHLDDGYEDWCLISPGLRTRYWQFGNSAFNGQFLFMRTDADGNIQKLRMNTGATYHHNCPRPGRTVQHKLDYLEDTATTVLTQDGDGLADSSGRAGNRQSVR